MLYKKLKKNPKTGSHGLSLLYPTKLLESFLHTPLQSALQANESTSFSIDELFLDWTSVYLSPSFRKGTKHQNSLSKK
jgi:hypothetical protein